MRIEHIYIAALKYITNNKSMILSGFIHFRLSNYMKILDYVVDTFVNELVDALINKGTLTHSEIMKLRKKHIT